VVSFLRKAPFPSIMYDCCAVVVVLMLSSGVEDKVAENRLLLRDLVSAAGAAKNFNRAVVTAVMQR